MTSIKNKILNDGNINRNAIEILDGWYPLVNEMIDSIYDYCNLNTIPNPYFLQIKQKLGQLRVYIEIPANIPVCHIHNIDNIIATYESKALSICVVTGNQGQPRNVCGWYCVLSEDVYNNLLNLIKKTKMPIWQILQDEYNIGLSNND